MTVNYALYLVRNILNEFVTDLRATGLNFFMGFFSDICHVGMFSSVWLSEIEHLPCKRKLPEFKK